ncbi:MAG: methylated-DNA--[protein]-cysteine S-methyltransferase [Bryobacteraceae bacterium]
MKTEESKMQFDLETFDSPLGQLFLASTAGAVVALEFEGFDDRMRRLLGTTRFVPSTARSDFRRRVEDYFAGDCGAVDEIPVRSLGTPFQTLVWQALRTIPASRTATYGELATLIGKPAAVRAVGHANSQNPVAIIQPCHRVIGANGTLTGYAGGLHRKHWLLRHEGALLL